MVDFQAKPVPAFKVKREDGQILVLFGNSLSRKIQTPVADSAENNSKKSVLRSPLAPSFVPAAAKPALPQRNEKGSVAAPGMRKLAVNEIKLSQSLNSKRPAGSAFPKTGNNILGLQI